MIRRFLPLAFLTLFALTVFAQEDPCLAHHCVGIVDVGSTGSRLFLYTYDEDSEGYPIQIKEQWSKKVSPGLATLDLKQEKIDAYLDELFSVATPASTIPVYVYATAGMRLLSNTKQHDHYEAVKHWFSTHSTSWVLKEAKTITGKEEGVYGWLAVNYKLNTFNDQRASHVGVMDMGGASVQIVFPVNQAITLPSARVAQVSLYGKTYTLYSYSALGLGQTLVTQQFLNHPACYASGYPLPDQAFAFGDTASCVKDVAHLVNDVHHVNEETSPLVNAEPRAWYVMGGINYTASNTLFHLGSSFLPAELFQAAAQYACSRPWSEVRAVAPQDGEMACLLASYYYALMVEGYGISTTETLNQMPDAGGWTLGVVLSL